MSAEDMVRVGTVTAVDNGRHIAKVWFDALEIPSDWMPVLITHDLVTPETEPAVGGEGEAAFAEHTHGISASPYMPKIGERVLVLCFPIFNGDGVILGGLQPWR